MLVFYSFNQTGPFFLNCTGPKPKTKAVPETGACRMLMLTCSFGPPDVAPCKVEARHVFQTAQAGHDTVQFLSGHDMSVGMGLLTTYTMAHKRHCRYNG